MSYRYIFCSLCIISCLCYKLRFWQNIAGECTSWRPWEWQILLNGSRHCTQRAALVSPCIGIFANDVVGCCCQPLIRGSGGILLRWLVVVHTCSGEDVSLMLFWSYGLDCFCKKTENLTILYAYWNFPRLLYFLWKPFTDTIVQQDKFLEWFAAADWVDLYMGLPKITILFPQFVVELWCSEAKYTVAIF